MGPPGDGTSVGWIVYDDKLYINLNQDILNKFLEDPAGNVILGNQKWTEYWGALDAGPFYPTCFSNQGGRCDDPGGDPPDIDGGPVDPPDPPEDPDPEKGDGSKLTPDIKIVTPMPPPDIIDPIFIDDPIVDPPIFDPEDPDVVVNRRLRSGN